MLRPIRDSFLFAFINPTKGVGFAQQNKGRIIIPNAAPELDRQGDYARWVRVLAVGPAVTDFRAGSVVLVSALKWTKGFEHDEVRVWKSDASHVLAIADDPTDDLTVDYSYTYY